MENDVKFKELLNNICERFEKKPSASFVNLIWDVVGPYPDDKCIESLTHVFKNCRYYKDLIPDLVEQLKSKKCPDWY